ncbi:MAG: leucine-rich repeat protein [Bacteroides sp.]|nr:leucine-rich repeat protein [Bacillota bacterium]MCM1393729.1 leucine-rich repeat protein [[Eubacterium] siraeum]MCM1455247.1 leucine-rich repeat protein [Bacteroides sp.]
MSKLVLTQQDKQDLGFFKWKIIENDRGEQKLVIYDLTKLGQLQTVLTIPDCVNIVGQDCFKRELHVKKGDFTTPNKRIRTVHFGKNVEEIEKYAFYKCYWLETLDFSRAENLRKIGESAFEGDNSIEELILPKNIAVIEDYAFCRDRNAMGYAYPAYAADDFDDLEWKIYQNKIAEIDAKNAEYKAYRAGGKLSPLYIPKNCHFTKFSFDKGFEFYYYEDESALPIASTFGEEEVRTAKGDRAKKKQQKEEDKLEAEKIKQFHKELKIYREEGLGKLEEIKAEEERKQQEEEWKKLEKEFDKIDKEEAKEKAAIDKQNQKEFKQKFMQANVDGLSAAVKLSKQDKKELKYFTWKIAWKDNGTGKGVVITGLSKLGKIQERLIIPDCAYAIADECFSEVGKHFFETLEEEIDRLVDEPQISAVVFGANLEVIGKEAFGDCGDLVAVDFSRADKLRLIKTRAFVGTSLGSFVLPKNLQSVESFMFGEGFSSKEEKCVDIYLPKGCHIEENSFPQRYNVIFYENEPDFSSDQENVKVNSDPVRSFEEYKQIQLREEQRDKEYEKSERLKNKSVEDDEKIVLKKPSKSYYKSHMNKMKYFDYDNDIDNDGFYFIKNFNENLKNSKCKTVEFPDFVTRYWGQGTFDSSFSRLAQGKNLNEDYEDMFYSKAKFHFGYVTRLILSRNLLSLTDNSFLDCISLKKVNLEKCEHLKTIPYQAFAGTGIEKITIPKNVKTIGEKAFFGCHSLKEVTLAKNSKLEFISSRAFANCKNLKIVDLSNAKNLTQIDGYAFGADAQSSLVLTNGKIDKVLLADTRAVDIAGNVFGNNVPYEIKDNAIVPDKTILKKLTKIQEEEIKREDEERMKIAWERAKEREAEQLKNIEDAINRAEYFKNLADDFFNGENGKSKDLDKAIEYYELSYKADKNPYVESCLRECKELKKSGVVFENSNADNIAENNYAVKSDQADVTKTSVKEPDKANVSTVAQRKPSALNADIDIEQILRNYNDGFEPMDKLDKNRRKRVLENIEFALSNSGRSTFAWECLGEYFWSGHGCVQNELYAVKCFEKALGRISTQNLMRLADSYYSGRVVDKNLKKAFNLYNRVYTRSIADFNGERTRAKEMIDKISSEDSSLSSVSDKSPIDVKNIIDEIQNRLREEYKYVSRLSVFVTFELEKVVEKYPKNMSYIPHVKIIVSVSGVESLSSAYTSNQDSVRAGLRSAGINQDFVEEFNMNDDDLWTNDTIREMGNLKSKIENAKKDDEYRMKCAGSDAFKTRARQIINAAWNEFKAKYEIVGTSKVMTSTIGKFGGTKYQSESGSYIIKDYDIYWKGLS